MFKLGVDNRGVDIPSLNLDKQWQFTPANFREGQIISGGDIFGTVINTFCLIASNVFLLHEDNTR